MLTLTKEQAKEAAHRTVYDARRAELQANTRGRVAEAEEWAREVRHWEKVLRMLGPYSQPARYRGGIYCALRVKQFIRQASAHAPLKLGYPEAGEPLTVTAGGEQLELQDWTSFLAHVELPDLLDEIGPLIENRKG